MQDGMADAMETETDSVPPAMPYHTRVALDILASQLLDERELLASSLSDVDLTELSPPAKTDVETNFDRPPSSMSLHTVARTQQMLHKQIPFVRGGACVEFTRDDLANIHDAETLRFLQENAQAFTRWTHPRRLSAVQQDNSGAPPLTSSPQAAATAAPPAALSMQEGPSGGAATTKAQLEADIEELQREIDTFITAVDDDGHTYDIQLHAEGILQVPVDTEDATISPMDSGDDDAEDVETFTITTVEDTSNTSSLPTEPPDAPFRTPSPPPSSRPAKTTSRPAARTTGRTPPKVTQRPLVTQKPPSLKVRTARQLSDEDERRISALLDGGVDSLSRGNPYGYSDEVQLRMAHIDGSLDALRRARGAGDHQHSLDEVGGVAARPTTGASSDPMNYLAEAKAVGKADRHMGRLNARLLRLEREIEKITLYGDTVGIPPEVVAGRPAWAREKVSEAQPADSLIADDALVEELLKEAALEQARAAAAGVPDHVITSSADPFASLRTEASAVAVRAVQLLAQLEETPLKLTDESVDEVDSDPDAEAAQGSAINNDV